MSDITPNLRLPYIQSAQAQKHVTHNEAIRALDALVQISVASRTLATPPATPVEGARFIVPAGATGAWTGFAPHIAAHQDGAWVKYAAREGWLVWVEDEDRLYAFDGTAWAAAGGQSVNPAPLVGVNTTADTTNRLAVAAPATLFTHAGNDHRHKINKATAADTASLLYQTGFSGRAEVGLTGDDNLHLKVSPDGTTWKEALVVDRSTGAVSLPFTSLGGTLVNPWQGRRWTALGTSITIGGLYTTPLATLLGATLTNLGFSGGRVSGPAGGGGLEIYGRVANVPADAELVTLEAGINDFRTNVPLGTPADTTTATFHGALFRAGADILAANPQRVLVYLTPYANSEGSNPDWDTANANGNTIFQFQQAVRDIARRLGCPVIDIGGESSISAQTASAYLSDGLHPNAAGGKRMADFIYDRLLFVRPPVAAPGIVATPVFSPATGTYATAQSVTITCATPDASIRYTIDGSTPTAASLLYTAPVTVSATTTLKAIAFKPGLIDSALASATITISPGNTGGGSSGTFAPASLTPTLWFDASDLSTLFQDTGGASPVTRDSQAIALIRDKSGHGRDLTQDTAAIRPLYRTAGALSWFEFDGTKKAQLASRYTTNADDFAVSWASRKIDTSPYDGDHSVIAGITGGQTWLGDNVLAVSSPAVEYATASGTAQHFGGFNAASIHVDHVSIINVAAGTLRTYLNGVAGNTVNGAVSVTMEGLTFANSNYLYSGRIYQFMVFPRGLTAAEIADLTDWMKAKAGL